MLAEGGAAQTAVGGGQAVGGAERLLGAQPVVHPGVVRQLAVDPLDGLGQLRVAGIGEARYQHRDVGRQRLAMQPGLGDRQLLDQLGLDPFRVDVAAEGGDELVLLASVQDQETVLEVTEIAAAEPFTDGAGSPR